MINFMLPTQVGAMTLDGTWLIAVGIIVVAGVIYKNRNSIAFTNSETNTGTDSNIGTAIENNNTDIQTNILEENDIGSLDDENITLENEKILN